MKYLHYFILLVPFIFWRCESKNTYQETDNLRDNKTQYAKYSRQYSLMQVRKMASEVLEISADSIKYETSLSDLGLKKQINDIDYAELVMHIEAEFEIEITDEQAQKFSTIGEICDYIDEKKSR